MSGGIFEKSYIVKWQEWVDELVEKGVPIGRILQVFRGVDLNHVSKTELDAMNIVWLELWSVYAGNNQAGLIMEKHGRIDLAIEYYEHNVAQEFEGYRPYERLIAIYEAQGRWADAYRVARAFIQTYTGVDWLNITESYFEKAKQFNAKKEGLRR